MPRVNRTAEEEEARRENGEFIESLDRGLRFCNRSAPSIAQ
jgi:IclR family pca regulon transcriptional regulator